MNQDIALPQLRDDVLAVRRFLAHQWKINIIKAHSPPSPAAARLHAGASGKDDHHVTTEVARDLGLTYTQALARGHHEHNRHDAPGNTKHRQEGTKFVRPESMKRVGDEVAQSHRLAVLMLTGDYVTTRITVPFD